MKIKNFAVLGAGSWGATLAKLLSDKKYDVALWEFEKESAELLAKKRTLPTLPKLKLPHSVKVTSNLEALCPAGVYILAVPSYAFRGTLVRLKKIIGDRPSTFLIATKGFEVKTGLRMSEVLSRVFAGAKIAALTGPSHAEEVVSSMPTAITVSSKDPALARSLQRILASEFFRVYTNKDLAGSEIAGAIKNIYAIAAGICDGIKIGDNAKAALITRALSEMTRFGTVRGGASDTFYGLAGVGDLVVTCYSRHSRNRMLGELIGEGLSLKKALLQVLMVAEGVYCAKAVEKIRKKLLIDMPIAREVYNVLYGDKSPVVSIRALMSRPLKSETD